MSGAEEDFTVAIERVDNSVFSGPGLSAFMDFNQGCLSFVQGNYEGAIGSWTKAIEENTLVWQWQLPAWIEKAKAKLQDRKR
jgi:hypothetical protein